MVATVGKKNGLSDKEVHVLTPRTCEYVPLDSRGELKLRMAGRLLGSRP